MQASQIELCSSQVILEEGMTVFIHFGVATGD